MKKPIVNSLSVTTVNVPLKRPIVASLGTFEKWPYMLIEITCNDGTVGKGYIGPYLINYTPAITLTMKELFKIFQDREIDSDIQTISRRNNNKPFKYNSINKITII